MLELDAVYWYWWIAGAVLIGLEIFVSGFVLLWFGLAAGIAGLAAYLYPALSWQAQVLIFAGCSLAALAGWTAYRRARPDLSDQPALNRRADSYVGRSFVLTSAIHEGQGMIVVDDSRWKVRCETDLEAGARVKVVGAEGTVLLVEEAVS